jgi:hypothetical protein
MKKQIILMIVLMFMTLVPLVRADENGDKKAGRLFFFHKYDGSLMGTSSLSRAVVTKMMPVLSYDDDDEDDDGSYDYDDEDGDDD